MLKHAGVLLLIGLDFAGFYYVGQVSLEFLLSNHQRIPGVITSYLFVLELILEALERRHLLVIFTAA